MLSSPIMGCPTTAITELCDEEVSAGSIDKEAVWSMCVCGIDTVMVIQRGGLGEGGAALVPTDSTVPGLGRRTDLWLYD